MQKKNVVIIGANLAGLNCALNLDNKLYNITIIDKSYNPGLKCCAGGVSSKCNEFIPKRFHERSFKNIKIKLTSKEIIIDRKDNPLHTIDREKYVKFLLGKCIKKGINLLLGFKLKIKNIHKKHVVVEELKSKKNKEKKIFYDILIGADGAGSVVRSKLNLKNLFVICVEAKTNKIAKNIEIIVDPKVMKKGYYWIFPHKDYTSIGSTTKIALDKYEKNYYDLKCFPIQYNYSGYKFKNKYLIGEAAGLASALTGEGIYFAIVSGIELAYELNSGKKSKKLKEMIKKLNVHYFFSRNFFLIVILVLLLKVKLFQKMIHKFLSLKV